MEVVHSALKNHALSGNPNQHDIQHLQKQTPGTPRANKMTPSRRRMTQWHRRRPIRGIGPRVSHDARGGAHKWGHSNASKEGTTLASVAAASIGKPSGDFAPAQI